MFDNLFEIKELQNELSEKLGKSDKYLNSLQTVRKHTDMLLQEAFHLYDLNYIDKHEYTLLCYACERHDYGKINEKMQDRLKKHYKFNSDEEVQHNILSALFIHREDFENDMEFRIVLYAVLYHHDNRDSSETLSSYLLMRYREGYIKQFLENYKEKGAESPDRKALKFINKMLEYRDCDREATDNDTYETYRQMIKMKGLLHKCDYSASADEKCEYKNDFLSEALERHLNSFSSANEKAEWNNLQKFSRNHSDTNIIVVAPTGLGKTEAGLLWAGNNKCFFVLPLKTAINAIYDRIRKQIIHDEKTDEKVAILHSDMQSYYYNEAFKTKDINEEDMLSDYINRSRQLALPITVSTMDQLFNFTLKYYGYELKLATLSYSKIIIDEIQMYSADLLAYLIFGIEKIVEMGGKVAVLTATLPPFVKNKLCSAMGDEVAFEDFSSDGETRHNIKVREQSLTSDDIVSFWKNNSDMQSCKILVICNSIKTAQRIFDELREQLGDDVKINLFHSRFTRIDRNKKEEDIIQVGKTENYSHEIWVATSVVEASLDIDFDFLFTELLDLFSVFQRFGRVNRKGLKTIEQANCFIYTELQDAPLRYYKSKDKEKCFVDNDIYDLSKEAIMTVDGLLSEEAKTSLINTYLSEENLRNSGYIKRYNDAVKYLKELYPYQTSTKNNNIRDIHNIDIIPASVYDIYQKDIDEAQNCLCTEQLSKADRIKEIEIIRGYIVSVPYWMVASPDTIVVKKIELYKGTFIPIVDCDYTFDMGLVEIYKQTENGKGKFL